MDARLAQEQQQAGGIRLHTHMHNPHPSRNNRKDRLRFCRGSRPAQACNSVICFSDLEQVGQVGQVSPAVGHVTASTGAS